MPIIGAVPKKNVEAQYEMLKELQQKCDSCKLFKGKEADNIFVYIIRSEYATNDGPAMLAIARYGDTYAIHPPKYLAGEQWVVLEFLLDNADSTDELLVFSSETFRNIEKYCYDKKLNVKLYI
ncbi:MAG: hypothetical protein HFJ48_07850 [Clostridia bacterium]|nr:hypothetical protein [Clostridia bacterium]